MRGMGIVQTMTQVPFGGNWSRLKLEIVQKYLHAYTRIMNNQKGFRFAYVDAFAGTGYQSFEKEEKPGDPLFPELATDEATNLEGSARIALKVEPRFDVYIFIEKDKKRFDELAKLKSEFPHLDIRPENREANEYLIELCRKNWRENRAVLFLDPFGMQVKWETIKAVASTKAIDLWYLFPAGIGVNRLLKTDGSIPESWRIKLDEALGDRSWETVFYSTNVEKTLFGEETQVKKVGDFAAISQYFVNRLRTIFPYVASNPFHIRNTNNSPMYILCFASTNATAARIAEEILKKY